MTIVDPREVVKCACPRLDAADCLEFRSGRFPFDEDDRRRIEPEYCECSCHDPGEDDDDDCDGNQHGPA